MSPAPGSWRQLRRKRRPAQDPRKGHPSSLRVPVKGDRRALAASSPNVEVALARVGALERLCEREVEFALVEASGRATLEGAVVGVDGPQVSGVRIAINAAVVERAQAGVVLPVL